MINKKKKAKPAATKKRWWLSPAIDLIKTFGLAALALLIKKKAK